MSILTMYPNPDTQIEYPSNWKLGNYLRLMNFSKADIASGFWSYCEVLQSARRSTLFELTGLFWHTRCRWEIVQDSTSRQSDHKVFVAQKQQQSAKAKSHMLGRAPTAAQSSPVGRFFAQSGNLGDSGEQRGPAGRCPRCNRRVLRSDVICIKRSAVQLGCRRVTSYCKYWRKVRPCQCCGIANGVVVIVLCYW